MDFQRLFKRKQEGPAPPLTSDVAGDALRDRDVVIREGELLDGSSPAPVDWTKAGGAITVKAGKILGILEGRTRIKAGVLEELHPGKFGKALNPDLEFNIPLHVVVMQIQDIFCSTPVADADLEGLETPFAKLAREDEARFKNRQGDRPLAPQSADPRSLDEDDKAEEISWSALASLCEMGDSTVKLDEQATTIDEAPRTATGSRRGGQDDNPKLCPAEPPQYEASADIAIDPGRSEQPKPMIDRSGLVPELRNTPSGMSTAHRRLESHGPRRNGHERLQELYLTDEPLDGAKISELVRELPRVTGVVIMLSDGAVLGGELVEGISEELLGLTPDFVSHLSRFTEILPGGPTRSITFFAEALQISLVIGGDVLMLIGHEGKKLPPGLRERLIATAEALNIMYGPLS